MFLKRLMLPGCMALSLGCSSLSKQECPEECQPPKYPAEGCYSPCCDPKVTRMAAKHCAKAALGDQDYPEEFEDGFIQAYMDLAEGASGVTPAVPPEKYWAAWYRTEQGHHLARVWFEGYEAGVNSARAHGLDRYNRVPTSAPPGMYRDNTNKTSTDPSVGGLELTGHAWPGRPLNYAPTAHPPLVEPAAPMRVPETAAPVPVPAPPGGVLPALPPGYEPAPPAVPPGNGAVLPALPPAQQELSRRVSPVQPSVYPASYPAQPRVSY